MSIKQFFEKVDKPVFIPLIKKGLSEERHNNISSSFYGSLAAQCPRRLVLHTVADKEQTRDSDPSLRVYSDLGIAFEDSMAKALNDMGKLVFTDYRLPTIEGSPYDKKIGGKVDIVAIGNDDKLWGIEVKTCGRLPGQPKKAHLYQAELYSVFMGIKFILLYGSRNVADWRTGKPELLIREFVVDPSPERAREIISDIFYAMECDDFSILPQIPDKLNKTACRSFYCPFVDFCWNGKDEKWLDDGLLIVEEDAEHVGLRAALNPLVDDFFKNLPNRRNGILSFFGIHGTDQAKEFLAGSWEDKIALANF